jgi:SAM-dependent methyltransferase
VTGAARDPREVWEDRYARRGTSFSVRHDPWLAPWLDLIDPGASILDLGCGPGRDTRFLRESGYRVTAADLAFRAAALAGGLQADLSRPLPFRAGAFDAVLTNLSLHYFDEAATRAALVEIHRILVPGGIHLARYNSLAELERNTPRREEIGAGFFRVGPVTKRFFDRGAIEDLYSGGFTLRHLEERTTHCYTRPKHCYEVVAIREESP